MTQILILNLALAIPIAPRHNRMLAQAARSSFEGSADHRTRRAAATDDRAQPARPTEYVVELSHLGQDCGCKCMGDQQLQNAGFAAELVETHVEFSVDFGSGLSTPSQHFATRHWTSIRGHKYLVSLQSWHIVTLRQQIGHAVRAPRYLMFVLVRYRYRIEPKPAQAAVLARVFGCCRVVFNDAL